MTLKIYHLATLTLFSFLSCGKLDQENSTVKSESTLTSATHSEVVPPQFLPILKAQSGMSFPGDPLTQASAFVTGIYERKAFVEDHMITNHNPFPISIRIRFHQGGFLRMGLGLTVHEGRVARAYSKTDHRLITANFLPISGFKDRSEVFPLSARITDSSALVLPSQSSVSLRYGIEVDHSNICIVDTSHAISYGDLRGFLGGIALAWSLPRTLEWSDSGADGTWRTAVDPATANDTRHPFHLVLKGECATTAYFPKTEFIEKIEQPYEFNDLAACQGKTLKLNDDQH